MNVHMSNEDLLNNILKDYQIVTFSKLETIHAFDVTDPRILSIITESSDTPIKKTGDFSILTNSRGIWVNDNSPHSFHERDVLLRALRKFSDTDIHHLIKNNSIAFGICRKEIRIVNSVGLSKNPLDLIDEEFLETKSEGAHVPKTYDFGMWAIGKEDLENSLKANNNFVVGYFAPPHDKLVTDNPFLSFMEKYIDYEALRMKAMGYEEEYIVIADREIHSDEYSYISLISTIVKDAYEAEAVAEEVFSDDVFKAFYKKKTTED